jgi:Peptidase family M23
VIAEGSVSVPPFGPRRTPPPQLRVISRRTTTRGLLLLLVLGAFSGTAQAAVPRLAFPVVGNVSFTNDYGAPRPGGWHQGNDLMARWRAPVIAAERGTVQLHTGSTIGTCMLYLHGASGYTYVYIHLNNDLTAKSEDSGGCTRGVAYAPGLRSGDFVRKGELLGYVGDSGDAENGMDHLHFEIRRNGTPQNPYNHLRAAPRALYPKPATVDPIWLRLRGRVLSVTSDAIEVEARNIRMSNGWVIWYKRRVVLSLSEGTVYERRTSSGPTSSSFDAVRAGDGVRVWTPNFTPTWRTQRAPAGTLAAATVRTG